MEVDRDQILRDLSDLASIANGPNAPPRNFPQHYVDPVETSIPKEFHSRLPKRRPESVEMYGDRDAHAVFLSKSSLEEGDTLVILRFPNNLPVYDTHGFRVAEHHRVHSEKLLATGSNIFQYDLLDERRQRRQQNRNNLLGNLPDGIRYVLDLTPPEEGDDALKLTAELSCSLGIRQWYKTHYSINVSKTMVGGHDETHFPFETRHDSEPGTPEEVDEIIPHKQPDISEPEGPPTHKVYNEDAAFQRAVEASLQSDNKPTIKRRVPKETEVLDYCPLRHRTGILRLLQVIEGKNPGLDSAPKVWTLAVLGKHFECPAVVVDYVVTWIIAEPNCRILDILPEEVLRIGIMLENYLLTRNAYAILVSEEAFRIATAKHGEDYIKKYPSKFATKFGRRRESLDEDVLTLIQHAGQAFQHRIENSMSELLHPHMLWLENLPEFQKITAFHNFGGAKPNSSDLSYDNTNQVSDELVSKLEDFVRGRLMVCFFQSLGTFQAKDANEHRWAEQHQTRGDDFSPKYDSQFADHERYMTKFFWILVSFLDWNPRCATNLILDQANSHGVSHDKIDQAHQSAIDHNIGLVTILSLRSCTDRLNLQIAKAIHQNGYNNGKIPEVATKKPSVSDLSMFMTSSQQYLTPDPEKPGFWRDALKHAHDMTTAASPPRSEIKVPWNNDLGSAMDTASINTIRSRDGAEPLHSPIYDPHPRLPSNTDIGIDSPFFNLTTFLTQVYRHINELTNNMLSKNDSWSQLCDTLLCLTDDEYKFLPLWAGGMDDGTGAVFEAPIPAADRGGPMGPGPAYHTGSTVNSVASSEFDFVDRDSVVGSVDSERFQSSMDVLDGFSKKGDRRRVWGEDAFMSDAGSESEYEYVETEYALPIRDKGKGKEVVGGSQMMHLSGSGGGKEEAKASDNAFSDDFFNTPDGDDGDYDFGVDSGDETA